MIYIIASTSAAMIAAMFIAIRFPQFNGMNGSAFSGPVEYDRDFTIHEKIEKKAARLYQTLYKKIMDGSILYFSDAAILERIEIKLLRARLLDRISPAEYIVRKLLAVCISVSLLAILSILNIYSIPVSLLVGVICAVFYLPDYYFEQRAKKFETLVVRELPQAIEMLMICSDSGMSLVSAIEIVAEKKGGMIGSELGICLQEMALGIRIQETLYNFSKRNRTREVLLFTNSIIQALRMGTSMSSVLRNLSNTIRENERQRLDSIIGSIPMKLTVVTMLFFMPIVFIIVLFPSLLAFLKSGW